MAGVCQSKLVVRVSDSITQLPHRIVISSTDMDQILQGRVTFIKAEPRDGVECSQRCELVPPDSWCAWDAVVKFKGDQIYVVRGYDPCSDMWELQWPD